MRRIVLVCVVLLAAFAVFRPRPTVVIDEAMRAQAIDRLVAGLNQYYVFPDKARQAEALLRQRQKDGAYDGAKSGVKLARLLEADLTSVVHDRHLRVGFSLERLPPQRAPTPFTQEAAPDAPRGSGNVALRWLARIWRSTEQSGVDKAVHLSPKIGYLKISEFPELSLTTEKYANAMNELADTDALIVDLRDNRGGSPQSVALLISYFVDRRTRLNDIWFRASGESAQFWTEDKLAGKRYGGRKPVLILAGPRTGSAGEDFTYTMQALKRATVIGERTWGGAHPLTSWRLGDHLFAGIPAYRSISPITHGNWEGAGVMPDVAAPSARALGVAQALLQRQTRLTARR